MDQKLKKLRNKNGFTLIEILVVLIIVGVLAMISLKNYFLWIEKSRSAEAIGLLEVIKSTIEPQIQAKSIAVCDAANNSIPIPAGSFHDFIYNIVDSMPQGQNFIFGTTVDTMYNAHSIGCMNGALWIGAGRKTLLQNDPCATAPYCQISGCGSTLGTVIASSVWMCRDSTGTYSVVGAGLYN